MNRENHARRPGPVSAGLVCAGARARFAATLVLALAIVAPAEAAPPLLTEHAQPADRGELAIERWLEGAAASGDRLGLAMVEVGYGAADWLEIAVAAGVGVNGEGGATVPNPYAQFKLALVDGADRAYPSVGLFGLVVPPIGRGAAYGEETATALFVPATFALFDDTLWASANLGITAAISGERMARLHWAAAVEAEIPDLPLAWIAEVTAGDPFDPGGPREAAQAGLLFDLPRGLGLDVALGVMLDPDDRSQREWIGRVGLAWAHDLGGEASGDDDDDPFELEDDGARAHILPGGER